MIRAYLTDPVVILRHGARDAFNQAAAPTREASLAYLEWGTRLIRNVEGEQVVAAGRALMEFDATLGHEDKIEVEGVSHSILRIERAKDFSDVGMYVYLT